MAITYSPIAKTTLGSPQTDVEFTSISQSYTDLIIVISGSADPAQNVNMRVGDGSVDTGTNYSATYLAGNGTSASSGRFSTQSSALVGAIYTDRGNCIVHLQNYSNTTTYKTFLGRQNSAGVQTGAYVALWRSTAAINTIRFINSFDANTSLTLYGIASA
jgi:hypothetical protein